MTPPRPATPTVSTLEDYCQACRDCFPDVRAFERFESLLLGLLSDLPRKSLPAIARHLDLPNSQGLDHFLRQSPWSVQAIQQRRLDLVR